MVGKVSLRERLLEDRLAGTRSEHRDASFADPALARNGYDSEPI